ncbi:ATP-binding cassette sub-family G member 1 [Anabrus simplex]|uniref:ATP-binding cassette sub-family G member 1 n=1 Tax=Anabrus simplex TaxID=316456 RepID=UPI0035A32E47
MADGPVLEKVNNNMFHYSSGDENSSPQRKFPRKSAVDVKFRDVSFSTTVWSVQQPIPKKKEILHEISGHFRAGELTAIMGPSGAGKSTLLNVLAGYTLRGCTGQVSLNGRVRTKANRQRLASLSCYIQQDDRLRNALTPLEAMTLAAHLKLGNACKEERAQQVDQLLNMLGLSACQNTRTLRLSGGQKKRLSVALELISNPPVIFLDEPTTGLDSSSCSQCVSLLKLLAQEGRTVICTIHQPSALLFEMFDHLYALADGRCIYQGSITGLLPFLEVRGLSCPPYHNPADFLMDVAMGEYGADVEGLVKAADALKPLAIKNSHNGGVDGTEMQVITKGNTEVPPPPPDKGSTLGSTSMTAANTSLIMQFLLLYSRNLTILRRDYSLLAARIAAHVLIGILFGYLYRNCGYGANTVLANFVYVYGTVLFLQYTGKMGVTMSFPVEMRTLRREHFNRWYSLGPYFMSLLSIEIPLQILVSLLYLIITYLLTSQPLELDRMFLFFSLAIAASLTALGAGLFIGATLPVKIAVFVGPIVLVALSMFGFNVFKRDIPYSLMWLYHISYFRAALHGMMDSLYTLRRPELPCPKDMIYCHYRFPGKLMKDIDIQDVDVGANMAMICGMGLLLYSLAVFSVWIRLNRR